MEIFAEIWIFFVSVFAFDTDFRKLFFSPEMCDKVWMKTCQNKPSEVTNWWEIRIQVFRVAMPATNQLEYFPPSVVQTTGRVSQVVEDHFIWVQEISVGVWVAHWTKRLQPRPLVSRVSRSTLSTCHSIVWQQFCYNTFAKISSLPNRGMLNHKQELTEH